jgi:hypothetical protein
VKEKKSFSLSLEMEKVYRSIQSVLATLKVDNFRVKKGSLAVHFPLRKASRPLMIRDIDFFIKGLTIDGSKFSQNPNSFTENIQLNVAGQKISFPDGNKTLAFSSFRFNANSGNLEADSCHLSGGDEDSDSTSFSLFAEKMRIKNIYLAENDSTDYNRIDSLYFTNPRVAFAIALKEPAPLTFTLTSLLSAGTGLPSLSTRLTLR